MNTILAIPQTGRVQCFEDLKTITLDLWTLIHEEVVLIISHNV
jgi:hypothetical protein